MMDFGAPGSSPSHPAQAANRSIAGSIVKRNIFYYANPTANMLAAQSAPFAPELKPNGSDYNLFWSGAVDAVRHE